LTIENAGPTRTSSSASDADGQERFRQRRRQSNRPTNPALKCRSFRDQCEGVIENDNFAQMQHSPEIGSHDCRPGARQSAHKLPEVVQRNLRLMSLERGGECRNVWKPIALLDKRNSCHIREMVKHSTYDKKFHFVIGRQYHLVLCSERKWHFLCHPNSTMSMSVRSFDQYNRRAVNRKHCLFCSINKSDRRRIAVPRPLLLARRS
jgi:hypothetical protein